MKKDSLKTAKEKLGTILDKEVAQFLRQKATQEGRTISDIIQEAVKGYEGLAVAGSPETRLASARRFCSNPFHLTADELKEILHEDYYDQ